MGCGSSQPQVEEKAGKKGGQDEQAKKAALLTPKDEMKVKSTHSLSPIAPTDRIESHMELSPPPQGSYSSLIKTPEGSAHVTGGVQTRKKDSIDLERLPQLDAEEIAKTDFEELRKKKKEPDKRHAFEPEDPEPEPEAAMYQDHDSSGSESDIPKDRKKSIKRRNTVFVESCDDLNADFDKLDKVESEGHVEPEPEPEPEPEEPSKSETPEKEPSRTSGKLEDIHTTTAKNEGKLESKHAAAIDDILGGEEEEEEEELKDVPEVQKEDFLTRVEHHEESEHDVDIDAILGSGNGNNFNNSNADLSSAQSTTGKKCDPLEVFKAEVSNDGQEKFDAALRCTCLLTKPDELYNVASSNDVHRLTLTRALPHTINLTELAQKFPSLKIVEINGNSLGPQAFRAIMYAMATNTTITVLNVADNRADTDSAVSVGKMLKTNRTLESLNVSGNHLGNDYFSRCAGPALSENSVLQTLICESIGATDLRVLGENLKDNACLSELCIANNQLRNADNFIKGIDVWLQQTGCSLRVLQLRSVGLQASGFTLLQAALANNSSLTTLDVSANEVTDSGMLLDFVVSCCRHANLQELTADNIRHKAQAWTPAGSWGGQVSGLSSLSLSACQLEDDHLSTLATYMGQGALANLTSLDLSSNPNLSQGAMQVVHSLTLTSSKTSSLERLSLGLNSGKCVSAISCFPDLHYLNLRKATNTLPPVMPTQTLVLDGIKLSGVSGFGELLGSMKSLAALSLAGCQLSDTDLQPLFSAIATGLPLTMLKLAANRLQDDSITALVAGLLKHQHHPLGLLDISNNKVTSDGAKKLCELYTSNKHKSQLHSLNVANNQIDSEGVCALVSMVGKGTLMSVNFNQQELHYELEDMEAIYKQLTQSLGLTVKEENGSVVKAVSQLPSVPPAFNLKFLSLGGEAGELGQHLDSIAISTDFQQQKVVSLSLSHALQLAAFFQGNADGRCLLSSEEWNQMIGSDKGAPAWLQMSEHRERAVYFTGLPSSITVQKLEGLLESEADCEVEDICLMKDLVTKQNNGIAWALLPDEKSAHWAVEFYNRGEAVVFGSQFVISRLLVQVDDDASTSAQQAAKRDIAERLKSRRTEEAAHRKLINQSYQESQQRHAYRLAHPAYADGRIW